MSLVLVAILVLGAPDGATAKQGGGGRDAQLRFVHAVPGMEEASARVGATSVGSAAFGEAARSAAVPAGRSKLVLSLPGGAKLGAEKRLEPGASYTAVALYAETEGGAELRFYRDGDAVGRRARIRTIQAAPGLGRVDVQIGGEVLDEGVRYTQATPYATVGPGTYDWAATGEDGRKVAEAKDVPLTAGSSSTAVLVGTRGEPLDVVLTEDANGGPTQDPASGPGGRADGGASRWLIVVLAALAAGGLGALAHRVLRGRPTSGSR